MFLSRATDVFELLQVGVDRIRLQDRLDRLGQSSSQSVEVWGVVVQQTNTPIGGGKRCKLTWYSLCFSGGI